ncbi:MAG: arginine repressor [Actinomycetota bacterium]|nr:arginine repressor [Actinomycetota bacterium]
MRAARRRDLLRILHEGKAASQDEIVSRLRAAGHDVTQATVSRDLKDIGAAKLRVNGGFVYRLADDIVHGTGDLIARNLARTLEEFVVDVRVGGNLVVVSTAPGHAPAVARAIDMSELPEVLGTVAGDDTIFVAAQDESTAVALAERWGRFDRQEEAR